MIARDAAKKALDDVRRLMSQSSGSEKESLETFIDTFEAEIEGWKMRLGELEDEQQK